MATPFVANTPHPMSDHRGGGGGQSVINHGGQSFRNEFTPLTGMHSARSPNPTKSPSYHYSPFYVPVASNKDYSPPGNDSSYSSSNQSSPVSGSNVNSPTKNPGSPSYSSPNSNSPYNSASGSNHI